MAQIILNATHHSKAGLPCGSRLADLRVQKVLLFMEENYQRDLSLERMASVVHLSIWHLCHLFKSETGETPARHLKMIRLRRASVLLENRELSIKEVMNKVGLGDQSHFAKDFKRVYGLTPSQFRAMRWPLENAEENFIGPALLIHSSEKTPV